MLDKIQVAIDAPNPFMTRSIDEIIAAIGEMSPNKDDHRSVDAALDQCRLAMVAAIKRDTPGKDHTLIVEAAARVCGLTKPVAWSVYADVYRKMIRNIPAPSWIAEVNDQINIVGGQICWVRPDGDIPGKTKLTPARSSELAVHFGNQFVDTFHPRLGKVVRMRADRAWLINPHRKNGH